MVSICGIPDRISTRNGSALYEMCVMAEARVEPETWRTTPSTKPTSVISTPLCQMNRVLHQMQRAEQNRGHQNARQHAHRIHQHRLQEAAEQQFFDDRAERDAEHRDRDPARRIVQQLVERRFHVGNAQQIPEDDHDERQRDAEHHQMQRTERLRYPAERFEQRLAVAREKAAAARRRRSRSR